MTLNRSYVALAEQLIKAELSEHDRAQVLAFAEYLRAESRKRKAAK